MKLADHHQSKASQYELKATSLNKQASILAIIRFLLFITALVFIVYFANQAYFSAILVCSILFLVSFVALVKWHNITENNLRLFRNRSLYHRRELQRLKLDLNGLDGGADLLPKNHPYAADLDVFGDFSLFALVNNTGTYAGREQLANWLTLSATKEEIIARQKAVQELMNKESWREDFFAHNYAISEKEDPKQATAFIEADSKSITIYPFVFMLSWLLFPILIIFWQLDLITYHIPFYLTPAIYWGFLLYFKKKTKNFQSRILTFQASLKALINAAKLLKDISWESKKMQSIAAYFQADQSRKIPLNKLNKLMEYHQNQPTLVYTLLSSFFLFEYFMVGRIMRWHQQYARFIPEMMTALAEIECLISLAAWSERAEGVFPTFSEDFRIQGEELFHPLLGAKAIGNPLKMKGQGSILLITGSNMSGKSTYLRTLGANLVLAQAGGMVKAKQLSMPLVKLMTSMRKFDDLQSESSTFYTELKKLQNILTEAKKSDRIVFYMLDEILNGTNSQDRLKGTKSYLQKLKNENAFGIVTTHDLELTQLEKEWPELKNASFNSQLLDGKIQFEYRIKEGPCSSFNALQLMQQMGLADGNLQKE